MRHVENEQVIVASRWTAVVTAALAVVAVLMGIWALRQPQGMGLHVAGWTAIFFGGAAIPVLLVHLVRPARLHLTAQGMLIDGSLSPPKQVRWSDIEGFYVWKVAAARLPAFRYSDRHGPDGPIGRALHDRAGVDGALAAPWPLEPEVLVNVLNQYRQHYADGHSASS